MAQNGQNPLQALPPRTADGQGGSKAPRKPGESKPFPRRQNIIPSIAREDFVSTIPLQHDLRLPPQFLAEQEVTEAEFLMTVNRLAVKWASENVLNVMAGT